MAYETLPDEVLTARRQAATNTIARIQTERQKFVEESLSGEAIAQRGLDALDSEIRFREIRDRFVLPLLQALGIDELSPQPVDASPDQPNPVLVAGA